MLLWSPMCFLAFFIFSGHSRALLLSSKLIFFVFSPSSLYLWKEFYFNHLHDSHVSLWYLLYFLDSPSGLHVALTIQNEIHLQSVFQNCLLMESLFCLQEYAPCVERKFWKQRIIAKPLFECVAASSYSDFHGFMFICECFCKIGSSFSECLYCWYILVNKMYLHIVIPFGNVCCPHSWTLFPRSTLSVLTWIKLGTSWSTPGLLQIYMCKSVPNFILKSDWMNKIISSIDTKVMSD